MVQLGRCGSGDLAETRSLRLAAQAGVTWRETLPRPRSTGRIHATSVEVRENALCRQRRDQDSLPTLVSLPGLDHGQASQRSDLVLPHVTQFLDGVRQRAGVAD